MNYIAIIEGQQVAIPEETAISDEKLKLAITTYFPEYANAEITRQIKGDTTEIRLIKRAGTKGNCITELKLAPEQINPAFELAWDLRLLEIKNQLTLEVLIDMQGKINQTIKTGESWETYIDKVFSSLRQQPPAPSNWLAANGVYARSHRPELEICLQIAHTQIPGLTQIQPYFKFNVPKVPASTIADIINAAQVNPHQEILFYLGVENNIWWYHTPLQEASPTHVRSLLTINFNGFAGVPSLREAGWARLPGCRKNGGNQ